MGQEQDSLQPADIDQKARLQRFTPVGWWNRLTQRERRTLSGIFGGLTAILGIVSGIAQFVGNYVDSGLESLLFFLGHSYTGDRNFASGGLFRYPRRASRKVVLARGHLYCDSNSRYRSCGRIPRSHGNKIR
jgi:hypothetical protein